MYNITRQDVLFRRLRLITKHDKKLRVILCFVTAKKYTCKICKLYRSSAELDLREKSKIGRFTKLIPQEN